jgi:hypothetical protein
MPSGLCGYRFGQKGKKMILSFYVLICAYFALMVILNLFAVKDLRDKAMLAFMLIPFVLRMLLVK